MFSPKKIIDINYDNINLIKNLQKVKQNVCLTIKIKDDIIFYVLISRV